LKSLTSIDKTILALQEYQQATKRRITIEYVVLKEVNDRKRDARELIEIAKKLDSHVNLIPYNPSPALSFKPGNIFVLFRALQQEGVNVTIRKSLGREIQAACGQLANQ
jgi:23S rRNA (adenine2503-C2)-methyltransferase